MKNALIDPDQIHACLFDHIRFFNMMQTSWSFHCCKFDLTLKMMYIWTDIITDFLSIDLLWLKHHPVEIWSTLSSDSCSLSLSAELWSKSLIQAWSLTEFWSASPLMQHRPLWRSDPDLLWSNTVRFVEVWSFLIQHCPIECWSRSSLNTHCSDLWGFNHLPLYSSDPDFADSSSTCPLEVWSKQPSLIDVWSRSSLIQLRKEIRSRSLI